jgi:hypothetical protein
MKNWLLALILGAIGFEPAVADPGAVREAYVGSRDLPDAVAYVEFTRMLADTRSEPHAHMHLLAEAFGIDDADSLDADALRELKIMGAVFVSHAEAMELEEIEARIRIVCAPGRGRAKSDNAAYAALNAADDVGNSIRQKYLVIALGGMTQDQSAAFRRFLDEFKTTITYVKTDNRPSGPATSVQGGAAAMTARVCEGLQARHADILGFGGQ